MVVSVQLEGDLVRFRKDGQCRFTVELPAGATVQDLIALSTVPWEAIEIVAVNGVHVTDQQVLTGGDHIIFLAPVVGG